MGKQIIIFVCLIAPVILGACGSNTLQNDDTGAGTSALSSGTMPAGEEAPAQNGILIEVASQFEVVISINEEKVTFRLSEEAGLQIETGAVSEGTTVTFTTYSIGDTKETVDRFIIE